MSSPPGAKTGTTGAVTFAGASCTAGSFTGTWASSPTISIDMQLAFSGCRKVGGLPITVACVSTAVLTATGTTGERRDAAVAHEAELQDLRDRGADVQRDGLGQRGRVLDSNTKRVRADDSAQDPDRR